MSWQPAAANGGAISSYTVTASPGGAKVTVPGTSTSTTFTGLSDLTSVHLHRHGDERRGHRARLGPDRRASSRWRPASGSHGADRYATAVAVSQRMFPTGTWPDGRRSPLSSSPRAASSPTRAAGPLAAVRGPLLLVPPERRVPTVVAERDHQAGAAPDRYRRRLRRRSRLGSPPQGSGTGHRHRRSGPVYDVRAGCPGDERHAAEHQRRRRDVGAPSRPGAIVPRRAVGGCGRRRKHGACLLTATTALPSATCERAGEHRPRRPSTWSADPRRSPTAS